MLTVSDPEIIVRIRQHPWFGCRIFEITKAEQATIEARRDQQHVQKLQAAKADRTREARWHYYMGPRGPLQPRVELAEFPVRSRPTAGPARTPYARPPAEGRPAPRDRSWEGLLPAEWRSRR
jgi:hypothetical protein